MVAEATWAVYYFVFGVTLPYPSIADIFYIGGYFPILVGALLYISVFRVALSAKRLLAALLVIAVAVALAMTYVLPIEFSTGKPAVLVFTDLIYPILDLSLVSVAVLGVAIFFGGRVSRWWLLLGAAACLYVVGDEFFLYQVASGTYYNGDVDDLIFLFGYLTGALAFYIHRREF